MHFVLTLCLEVNIFIFVELSTIANQSIRTFSQGRPVDICVHEFSVHNMSAGKAHAVTPILSYAPFLDHNARRPVIWDDFNHGTIFPQENSKMGLVARLALYFKNGPDNRTQITYIESEMFLSRKVKLDYINQSSNTLAFYMKPMVLFQINTMFFLDIFRRKCVQINRANFKGFNVQFSELDISIQVLRPVISLYHSKKVHISLPDGMPSQKHIEKANVVSKNLVVLSGPSLTTFDKYRQKILESLFQFHNFTIDVYKSPLACGLCEHYESIRWLVIHKHRFHRAHKIVCTTQVGEVAVDSATVKRLQEYCERPMQIMTISCTIVAVVFLAFLFWHFKSRRRKRDALKETIHNMKNELTDDKYTLFLSNSSGDAVVVHQHILPSLKNAFQRITGSPRDIICAGDFHFRPGFPIADETVRCLHMSSVVMFVISDSFCRSDYCKAEFTQAVGMRMPIILMVEKDCAVELMPLSLRELFKKNARIVWYNTPDEFILKTTWGNICYAVLELATSRGHVLRNVK